ncbi:unnamed protein product (macronuclear) [Paramecium tetraurelia]|uniref:Uncharacterized protein n=1 Tax=Paramecium tetraurelia TaxID=5888 RepID=A0C7F9_PARTE|nr:uncharacterized protein GSPATT00035856001 [Paramecium tetraurelia]CAK66726.1 unnamed protein product [Paramecium tetraurelia]|eukprot:XP_001434123.1 hypothetical protein (macronuclear) [Paramecium tetraurelia strain d4-2]
MQQYYKIKIILVGKTKPLVLEKQDTTLKVFQILQAEEEKFTKRRNLNFFVPVLNRFVNIDETKLEYILENTESWSFELKEDQSQKKQTNKYS